MQYKAIIMDFGGIFTKGSLRAALRAIAERNGADPQALLEKSRDPWDEAKVGDDGPFWKVCTDIVGIDDAVFFDQFLASFTFDTAVLEYMRELKPQVRLALLSNNVRRWFDAYREKYALDGVFDPLVTSYEAGVAKPDPAVYEVVLERLDLPPGDCLFVDDSEKNLQAALELGMHVHHYTTLDALKNVLEE